jgi:predicted RNA-binding Zn-ribbon protein involved in translation (DUF1610 family)
MPRERPSINDIAVGVIGIGIFMMVVSGIAYPIAFGSGALLYKLTGIDFHVADWIITIAAGPVAFGVVILIGRSVERGPGDRRIRRAITKQGRFRKWSEVLPQLQAGQGTLIVELINFGPTYGPQWRTWWTPENALELGPAKPHIELCTCMPGEIPFVDWCQERYLDAAAGAASLFDTTTVGPPDMIVPEPLDCLSAPFQKEFPALSVVVLPMRHSKCPSCGYDLRATPNRCPECGKNFVRNATSFTADHPASPSPETRA